MEQAPAVLQVFLWSAVVYWAAGFFLLWNIPGVRRLPEGREVSRGKEKESSVFSDSLAEIDRVSVIIPARNEAQNVPVLLESLRRQRRNPLEIIVVDDQSSDGTGEKAAEYADIGVRVIHPEPRPDSWTGKNWSCHSGAAEARGDVFFFLDADTRLDAPDALERLLGEHSIRGGMISVQPYHRVRRLYEQMSGFFNLIVMIGSGAFSRWSRTGESTGCFGPCIILGRDQYYEIGGHEAIRESVVDDLALCGLCRKAGIPVFCFGGREVISFRMYPGGMRSLIEGWTKNMALGASLTDTRTLIFLVIWFTGISNAGLLILPVCTEVLSVPWMIAAAGVYGLYVLQVHIQFRRVGSFHPAAGFFFPILFLFFVAVFLYSIIRIKILKSVTWKGRSIAIGKGK